jgi:hypothetical protein
MIMSWHQQCTQAWRQEEKKENPEYSRANVFGFLGRQNLTFFDSLTILGRDLLIL